ncbi:MAG: hypothetical protein V3V14_01335 [Saprospiraceae bacterium]
MKNSKSILFLAFILISILSTSCTRLTMPCPTFSNVDKVECDAICIESITSDTIFKPVI